VDRRIVYIIRYVVIEVLMIVCGELGENQAFLCVCGGKYFANF
jgi:hypothetical protein